MNITRRSPFNSHRGRRFKRAGWTLAIVSLGLLILQGVTSGTRDEAAPKAAMVLDSAAVGVENPDPIVLPALANPPLKSRTVQTADPNRDVVTGRQIIRIKTQDDNDNVAVTQVAQKVAVAWGTYSHEQTAEEFIATLPSIAPGAEQSFLNQISGDWEAIQEAGVSTTASLAGSAPVVQAINPEQGSATVTVVVEQAQAGADSPRQLRFVVQLSRYEVERIMPPEDSSPSEVITSRTAWGVIGVRQQ